MPICIKGNIAFQSFPPGSKILQCIILDELWEVSLLAFLCTVLPIWSYPSHDKLPSAHPCEEELCCSWCTLHGLQSALQTELPNVSARQVLPQFQSAVQKWKLQGSTVTWTWSSSLYPVPRSLVTHIKLWFTVPCKSISSPGREAQAERKGWHFGSCRQPGHNLF